MRGADCVAFLQWCLPRLRMRWSGFRKVRSQVCKRVARRLRQLGLEDFDAYRRYLEEHEDEWARLDSMCRITISRFYRDRGVFETLGEEVLPALAAAAKGRGDGVLRAWSCGCASGEEAYALAVLWHVRVVDTVQPMEIEIMATDADEGMLERGRRGIYPAGSVRELPLDLRRAAFEDTDDSFRVRDRHRERVSWQCQDVRVGTPRGPFDLILCRNLVLTYFEEALQDEVMQRVVEVLRPGGALVIGSHESLPAAVAGCEPWHVALPIYRRVG